MGPTASGKTTLAVELQQRLPIEIVSVDSAMVYRGMDIGTAKPEADILAIAPHHLIDICDPAEIYSAGRFREDAVAVIDKIHARNRVPLLVGGTGLYFRTLEQGLSDVPPANPVVRAKLEQLAREIGAEGMHERLAEVDPASAQRIHVNDPQRIQRALEVYEITGKPISGFFSGGRSSPLPHKLLKIIIAPEDRSVIHEEIAIRFMQMIELGLINEVREFYARDDLDANTPSMRMVGYRQVWRYLDGLSDYETMLQHAIVATRQLAKRQMTWLRAEQNVTRFESTEQNLMDSILKILKKDPIFMARL